MNLVYVRTQRRAMQPPGLDLPHNGRRWLRHLATWVLCAHLGWTGGLAIGSQEQAKQEPFEATLSAAATWNPTPEELDEALDKWVRQFVTYIITDEERSIFEALPTAVQKLAFTERFWDIRDPTPGTLHNEYRQEHFERWVIAVRRFSAGKPGWSTDRGRVFIIMGAPNNLQRNPTGRGPNERASEVWTYNLPVNPLLPGVLDLNFVDFKGTGDYELVSDLDAAASIVSKQFGYVESPLDVYALRRHASQIYDENFLIYRFTDPTVVAQDFLQFQSNLREILRIPEIHKERLEGLRRGNVETGVVFDAFPISRAVEFYGGIAGSTAVQITLALEYNELTAAEVGFNSHFSTDTYVALERDGEVVVQDEKRLNFTLTGDELEQLGGTQILHTFQLLAPPGEYDLVVMARDNTSDRLGRRVESVTVPDFTIPGLRLSSLTLASHLEPVNMRANETPRDFQIGDMRVVPNVSRTYYQDQSLLLYVQAYGLALDPQANTNRVTLRGEIRRNGEAFRQIPAQYPAPAPMTRQSFSLGMPLAGYRPGVYEVVLVLEDELAGERVEVSTDFAVLPPARPAGGR